MPSDAEIVANWMEPRPQYPFDSSWWTRAWSEPKMVPVNLTLDKLWEAQERLTLDQWRAYEDLLLEPVAHLSRAHHHFKAMLHATPEQKIKALATVLKEQNAKTQT